MTWFYFLNWSLLISVFPHRVNCLLVSFVDSHVVYFFEHEYLFIYSFILYYYRLFLFLEFPIGC